MAKRTKKRTITCWIREDMEKTVDILKMRPGGFTGWLEEKLAQETITEQERAALAVFHK